MFKGTKYFQLCCWYASVVVIPTHYSLVFSFGRSDSKLVDEIVEGISKELMSEHILSSSDFEGLVGIRKRIEPVISLLCLDDKTDVRIIGIWGMGGIGKTTLVEATFKLISSQFEGACFIKNVREKLRNRDGLDCL